MPEFCTFLVFRPNEIDLIHKICGEAGWRSRDIEDPSTRYRFAENSRSQLAQASALSDFQLDDGEEYGRLLVLDCEEDEANNITQLIWAANLILEAFPPEQNLPSYVFALSDDDAMRQEVFHWVFRTDTYFKGFIHREAMPVAIALAAKAWSDRKLIYAIYKLARSYETESVTPGSMHPRHGHVFEKHTKDFGSHVSTSIAINLAYSAIEELHLSIRANNSDKRRSLSRKQFIWNPEVLKPLKARLARAGIDPERTIDWVARGDKTEVPIYEMLDEPTEYADGQLVRDRRVKLYDAINFCEYLRNTMTAHAFSGNTARLGPYEVYNAQFVARFLILAKCKLWGVRPEDLQGQFNGML